MLTLNLYSVLSVEKKDTTEIINSFSNFVNGKDMKCKIFFGMVDYNF